MHFLGVKCSLLLLHFRSMTCSFSYCCVFLSDLVVVTMFVSLFLSGFPPRSWDWHPLPSVGIPHSHRHCKTPLRSAAPRPRSGPLVPAIGFLSSWGSPLLRLQPSPFPIRCCVLLGTILQSFPGRGDRSGTFLKKSSVLGNQCSSFTRGRGSHCVEKSSRRYFPSGSTSQRSGRPCAQLRRSPGGLAVAATACVLTPALRLVSGPRVLIRSHTLCPLHAAHGRLSAGPARGRRPAREHDGASHRDDTCAAI